MITSFLKNLFMMLTFFYSYAKMINYKLNRKYIIFGLTASPILALFAAFAFKYIAPYNVMANFLVLVCINLFYHRNTLSNTVTVTFMSYSMCYVIYFISTFVLLPILYIFLKNIIELEKLNNGASVGVGIFQLVFTKLFFRIKRFKKGLALLEENADNSIGAIIGLIILFIVSTIYIPNEATYPIMFLLVGIAVILGALLFIWFRKNLNNVYIKKVNERNISILENSINELRAENNKYKTDNDRLASIIHRDNKILPAMEIAVKTLLDDSLNNKPHNTIKYESLISQLDSLYTERKESVDSYEKQTRKLPDTNVLSTNAVLSYLLNRATEQNTKFDLVISQSVEELIPQYISESDLNTLIADLGENALIAIKNQDTKNMMITVTCENSCPCINFFDSGAAFELKTLRNLGVRRSTTHAKEGGTGIGLMSTFKMLKGYGASFVINNTSFSDTFTKTVSVCFDGLKQYRIHTDSDELKKALRNRSNIVLV